MIINWFYIFPKFLTEIYLQEKRHNYDEVQEKQGHILQGWIRKIQPA